MRRPRLASRSRLLVAATALLTLLPLLDLVGAAPPVGAQDAEGESSPVAAGEAIGDERVVIADGHVDIGPRIVDGDLTLLVRDDTVDPSMWRRLPDVVLQATDPAAVEVPGDPQFSFLGAPGARVWLLPQVQQPGIVWPGWNTQDPEVATTLRREVTWTLTGVDGPGAFVLFVTEDFGRPAAVFDSRDPYPQTTGIDLDTHAHGNWAFTVPGVYRLDLEMSATTVDGDEVGAAGSLHFAVGTATDPQDAFAAAPADPVEPAEPADHADPGDTAEPADGAAADSADGDGSALLPVGLGALAGALLLVLAAAMARTRTRTRTRARRSRPASPGGG